jgi:predicted ArsR family transcriptional regulator
MTRGRNPTETVEDVIVAAKKTSGPVFGAREVSEQLDIGRQRVMQRLGQLEAKKVVECKEVGQQKVWWINDR